MNKHIAILVVEDNEDHIRDCQAMLNNLSKEFPLDLEIVWERNLRDAFDGLAFADWVMPDVFLLDVPGGDANESNGKKIVEVAIRAQKPVVWITNSCATGNVTCDEDNWVRHYGISMFDCPEAGSWGYAPHKPWKKALFGLTMLAVGIEIGNVRIQNGRIESSMQSEKWKPFTDLPVYVDRWFSKRYNNALLRLNPLLTAMLELGFPRE